MTTIDNASRGFLGTIEPCIIKTQTGRTAWNIEEYAFLQEKTCPDTVHPKLWRQGQLTAKHGLFEVAQGIYQVRGFDLANMTLVEGRTGVIVIDPLVSNECAAAAMSLYRRYRGERPLTGLIYSHSHVDHYGGTRGILHEGMEDKIPIIAPEGFMEEATGENVYAGPAMRRRARYMYGTSLPKGPEGQVGCGLGMMTSTGTTSLIPPNVLIGKTGDEQTIDNVRIVFQIVSGSEAPSEFNFYFPQRQALFVADSVCFCMHNITTLRGALVRDAKAWSRYLDECLVLFGGQATVMLGGHNWPAWGQKDIAGILAEHRDMYAFMHDQTVRLMNAGMTGIEIAETLRLPPALESAWHLQPYYGTLSHNVKGIYQRYMTWFDGNPVNLWKHPPVEEGQRYVACMGGMDKTVALAEDFVNKDDLRFASTLLGHAVAAEPSHAKARSLLISVLSRLGYGTINATWRNFFLTGAQDLQQKSSIISPRKSTAPDLNPLLSVGQWLEGISVQIDGPRAASESLIIDIVVTDQGQTWRLILSNGALTNRLLSQETTRSEEAGMQLAVTKAELRLLLLGQTTLKRTMFNGSPTLFERLLQFLPWANNSSLESRL